MEFTSVKAVVVGSHEVIYRQGLLPKAGRKEGWREAHFCSPYLVFWALREEVHKDSS